MNGAPEFQAPNPDNTSRPNPADTRIPPPDQFRQEPQQYRDSNAQQQPQIQPGQQFQQGASYAPHPPQLPVRRGMAPWAWGALAYVPIPFITLLIPGLVQWVTGKQERAYGGLAARNGIRAANWGLTQVTGFAVFAALLAVFYVLVATGAFGPPNPSGSHDIPAWGAVFPITAIVLYVLFGFAQLTYLVVGLVQTSKGREVKLPVIPFIKG